MSKTTIKSAMVIDKFIHHPGSGRAADNENDVATCRGPSIPKMLQGRDKIRACSIHPRQFIKKNHLTFYPVQRVEIRDKHLESIEPVVGNRGYIPIITSKRIKEVFQLLLCVSARQS